MTDYQKKYIGQHILIGLTYLEKDETIRSQIQLHGSVVAVSESTIVFKRQDNGEDFSIPFDESNISPSDPEFVYELKSTGEVIKGVNFTSLWTIHPSDEA